MTPFKESDFKSRSLEKSGGACVAPHVHADCVGSGSIYNHGLVVKG
jgi:hypothetical protein